MLPSESGEVLAKDRFDSRLGEVGVHGDKALAEWVYA